ncbi:MAG: family 16 glycoside hydrolase, partial [Verrucomicrobiota bacterium]
PVDPLELIRDTKPGQVWIQSHRPTDRSKSVTRLLWFDRSAVSSNLTESGNPSERTDGLVANGEWQDVLSPIGEQPSYSTPTWEFDGGALQGKAKPIAGETPATVNAIRGILTEPLQEYEARLQFTVDQKARAVGMFLPSEAGAFAVFYFNSKDGLKIGLQKHQDASRPAQPDISLLFPNDRIAVGETRELKIKVKRGALTISLDGKDLLSNNMVDWSVWDQSVVYFGKEDPIIGVRVENGEATFHSFEIRVPGDEPAPSTPAPTPTNISDIPEFRDLISTTQELRRTQLTALLGNYRPALARAEETAINAGDLARVEAIQSALQRADSFADAVAELPGQKSIEPLPALPPIGGEAPEELKRLRGIFDTEVAKIETAANAQLAKSLEALQSDLVKAQRIEEAKLIAQLSSESSNAVSGGTTSSEPDQPDWIELTNGTNLDGWSPTDPGDWVVRDGGIMCSGGTPVYLSTPMALREFELQGELYVTKGGNGGILFLSPAPGLKTGPKEAHELALVGSGKVGHGGAYTGGIFGAGRSKVSPDSSPLPDNTWGEFRLVVSADRIETWVGEVKTAEMKIESPSPISSHLALQCLPNGGTVGYRNLKIRTLATSSAGVVSSTEWTNLFNGRDLSGWTVSDGNEGMWTVNGTQVRHEGDGGTFLGRTLPYNEFEIEG